MATPRRLIWFLMPALLGISLATAVVVLAFSYFMNLRSETKLLMNLCQNIGQRFEQSQPQLNHPQIDSLLGSKEWAPAHLAIYNKNGQILAGEYLETDHSEFFQYNVPIGGEIWKWDDHGLTYMRPFGLGRVPDLWLRIRFPETPQAWDIDLPPSLSAGLVLLFAIIGISWYVSQRLQTPLDLLKAGVEQISSGHYVRLPSSEWEELDILAKAMNSMSHELEIKIRHLDEQRQEKEAILSGLDEGVLALDLRGRILDANLRAGQMLRLGGREIWHKKRIEQVVRNTRLQKLVGRLLGGEDGASEEIELITDRGVLDIEVRGAPLKDGENQTWGLILVFADLTRLHHLERVRRDFVSNVSHELRTPVTSIQGFAETLASGEVEDPAQQKHFLGIIDRQTKRLSQIIDDLLELSRLEQQMRTGEIEKEHIYICDLIENCFESARHLSEEKNIQTILNCDPELMFWGNGHLLEQALLNLITNAMRYSDSDKSVKVHVTSSDTQIQIEIQDQGYGIPSKHLDRIFERFYRVDKARSRSQGGTGLGLAIVRNIAIAHGGDVQVKSELGVGSCFSLSLPIMPEELKV